MSILSILTLFLTSAFLPYGVSWSMQGPTGNAKAADSAVIGKWKGIIHGAKDGDVTFSMELKKGNGELVGLLQSGAGNFTLSQGKLADGKLSMIFSVEDATGTMISTIKGNEMTGEWDFGDNGRGTFECRKEAN